MNFANNTIPPSDEVVVRSDKEGQQLRVSLVRTLKRWPVFLCCLLAFLLLTYLYLLFTIPNQKAVASLVIKDDKKSGELMDNSTLKEIGLGGNSKLLENEIEVLRSYDLMEAVVRLHSLSGEIKEKNKLRDVPVFGDEIPFSIEIVNPELVNEEVHYSINPTETGITLIEESNKNSINILYGKSFDSKKIHLRVNRNASFQSADSNDTNNKYTLSVLPLHEATTDFLERLGVEPVSKVATVIDLEITDENSRKAVQVLKSLLEIYDQWGLKDKNRSTVNTIVFLDERLREVASNLKGIEGGLQQFKTKNRITELSENSQQYLAIAQEVDNQKTQSQTQLKIIEALEKLLLENNENIQLVPSTLGIQEASLTSLIERHNELVLQRERIKSSSGPLNPLLIDLNNQLTEVRRTLLANVQNLKKAFTISLNQATSKDLELNNLIGKVPAYEKDMVNITRDQNVQKELYAFLLQKREEAAITGASNIEDSRIISRPRFSETVSPKKPVVWAVGILCGILLPAAFFSAANFFNNKVTDINQIKQLTSLPIIGNISHVKKVDTPIVISATSRSFVAEQFRSIRTSLSYTQKERKTKSILITSFQPKDGKSFVSMNLAMSYALLDKKTVVLEFDLRKPKISSYLGLVEPEGISSILSGKTELKKVLRPLPSFSPNLFLLPAGYLPPNPAELISSDSMKNMMEELKKEFDYIIIDTPPFGLVTDANLMEDFSDITLVVIRQQNTHLDVFEHLKRKSERFNLNPIYLILNDVGRRKGYEESYAEYGKGYYDDK